MMIKPRYKEINDNCYYKFTREAHVFVEIDETMSEGINWDNNYLVFVLDFNDWYIEEYKGCERVSLKLSGHSYEEVLANLQKIISIIN